MKLRTRLALIATLLIMVSSGIIGAFSVNTTRTSAIRQIDQTLSQVLQASNGDAPTAKNGIVPRADDLNVAVALGLVLPDKSVTVVRQAGDITKPYPFPTLGKRDISLAETEYVTIKGSVPYRVHSRSLGEGISLIAAAPLVTVNASVQDLITKTVIATFFVILGSIILVFWSTRRSLKPVDHMIDAATAIAAGDLDRKVPRNNPETELGRLGEALDEMITSLGAALELRRNSEEGMRQFMGDASHELRTPLTVIKGYGEMLRDIANLEPEQRSRAIDRLNAEAARMDALITDLLRLSRLDQHPVVERSIVDFSTVVRDFAEDLRDQERDRHVELDIDQDVFLTGDESLLRQVVANVVGNIRKHTPPGTPVKFSLKESASTITLVVDDGGSGIPTEHREAALARFGRLDSSRSRLGGGFGLGLSIVSQIIELHDGKLTLDESPLGGLRILITLPGLVEE